jgi:hypothetical protein
MRIPWLPQIPARWRPLQGPRGIVVRPIPAMRVNDQPRGVAGLEPAFVDRRAFAGHRSQGPHAVAVARKGRAREDTHGIHKPARCAWQIRVAVFPLSVVIVELCGPIHDQAPRRACDG